MPAHDFAANGRPRALTTSTSSTATPPKIDDQEINFDLGGDFGKMFTGFDKRASVATVRDDGQRGAPRSLTSGRVNQPPPALAAGNKPPHSPFSTTSNNSNDELLGNSSPLFDSPHHRPPQVPRHGSPLMQKSNRPSDIIEDEDTGFLKDSLAATKFLGGNSSGQGAGRYRRNEDSSSSWRDPLERKPLPSRFDKEKDDNMFDSSLVSSARAVHRYVARAPSPPRNRVMTPAQFERFKQEKERTSGPDTGKASQSKADDDDDDEEDNYEDDEDEMEKSKQAAKQRKKQEAHMAVYRQQMMKITGESANGAPRPGLPTSVSAPVIGGQTPTPGQGGSDGSDEDEEIPLAILAAHGFPGKNRPPTRLSSVGSNPNLRASMMTPNPQLQPPKPAGENPEARSRASHLPAFARNLPQDPFVGAGLVRNQTRESLALGGGAAATQPTSAAQAPLPPGGLVGVIASEERSRAMRRGSPQLDNMKYANNGAAYDPMAGISPHAMYGTGSSPSMPQLPSMGGMPMGPMAMGMGQMPQMPQMLTPGDQAQIQMTQQMQQFMQMQMQFMQMMAASQNGGAGGVPGMSAHMPSQSMADLSRNSFVGDPSMGMGMGMGLEPPRADSRMRTMSMVQPSSASWIQPAGVYGAPSIHVQGAGYAPSIAPSERSNIGLPGRYRPVSHAPPVEPQRRVSTMSGAISGWDQPAKTPTPPKSGSNSDDDDDESGWEAMKAKREKKKSLWKSKKGFGRELSAFLS